MHGISVYCVSHSTYLYDEIHGAAADRDDDVKKNSTFFKQLNTNFISKKNSTDHQN